MNDITSSPNRIPSRLHISGFYPDPTLYYIKNGVELHEYKMHKYVYNLGIVNVPKIIHYNKKTKVMAMNKIIGDNLSNIYGENEEDIEPEIFDRVREIIGTLARHNIEYPDITGYNFILDNNNKLWIVDFEHSKYNMDYNKMDEFINYFLEGNNEWNPEFK
jgi:tRNA A-37 threonylcarbamoyl transferase component Bud32